MKLDIVLALNRMVIDEAVQHTVATLLGKNLLLLGIGKLSFQGSHSELSHRKEPRNAEVTPQRLRA